MVDSPGAGSMIADFLAFSRPRSAAAIALVTAGALLEGMGVVMLVPIVALILDAGGAGGGELIAPVFAALGLETVAERIGAVLAV
ncbi:MAG: hypothetical protein IID49_15120, partial [Proteobacteria bacterium]|nr:hypothetical protein [Pseudomonadota bacterium]